MISSPFRLLALFMLLIAAGFSAGCTGNEDFANPLDPQNLRTAGSPIGLELLPGDEQVTVSWADNGHEGIIGYRIYRQFTGDADSTFEFVGEVLGENGERPATEFVDTQDLKNDQFNDVSGERHRYIYRISYIDANGVEVPDPNAPPTDSEDPRRMWQTASATPSIAPPIPNVIVGDDLDDLTVKLFWQDYEAPNDFEQFRVAVSQQSLAGEFLPFRLRAELPKDQPYFFDMDFKRDNATRIYRVIAVDRFGVEGVKVIQATSPNLPPLPPQNVRLAFGPRGARYDAYVSWSRNREPDVAGYVVYATKESGGNLVVGQDLIARRRVDAKEASIVLTGEEFILDGQDLAPRRYFVAAFDDTPQDNGIRDESERVEAR
ncbi:hypothetical protein J4G02_02110 [Candidatus Poribacteria bacterium]|nr:hypothetical protein [Candidatus Poribacteria bacterium]